MTCDAGLRTIPAGFAAGVLGAIDDRLAAIAREQHVTIALAIESGSRAWGFPSPDSDYDTRFVFVRRSGDYLSPWPKRDVIELAIEGDLDINGWELGKTLKLLLKGNAVAVEWLMSPIVYAGDASFRDELIAFASAHVDRTGIARHYLHLGERQRQTYFAEGKAVPLKKLFYALRPAASLRWLRLHPADRIAPMHFPTLIEQCAAPNDVIAIATDLVARKAVTRELGVAPLPPAIERFIDAEFVLARETLPPKRSDVSGSARAAAIGLFQRFVASFDASGGSTLSHTPATDDA